MTKELDANTETKIKNAARQVFHKKGFAATRTRDIAQEADINIALLNYYFRSKKKLFDLIMLETLLSFKQSLVDVFDDEHSTLEYKIQTISTAYIDLLKVEPHIPLFIMSELQNNPDKLMNNLNNTIMKSALIKQYKEAIKKEKIIPQNILHFVMNLMGLTIFPFISRPILKAVGNIQDEQFNQIMDERKKMIPIWMKAMLRAK